MAGDQRNGAEKIDEVIGFIGAGYMAQAIGFRLIDSGIVESKNIIVSAPSDRNLKIWKNKGAITTNINRDVVKKASIVFIAVERQYFDKAASSLKQNAYGNWDPTNVKCFVSIMAGKDNISSIRKTLPGEYYYSEIIRIMPNKLSVVGEGCTAMCKEETPPQHPSTHHCETPDDHYRIIVYNIMKTVGMVEWIPEILINAVWGLTGSGPAFMYLVMEAMADGAVRLGVPRATALKMAAQVMKGAGEMVLKTSKHPGVLKDEVCSPAGTAIAGIHALESGSTRVNFMNAIAEANFRANEIFKVE